MSTFVTVYDKNLVKKFELGALPDSYQAIKNAAASFLEKAGADYARAVVVFYNQERDFEVQVQFSHRGRLKTIEIHYADGYKERVLYNSRTQLYNVHIQYNGFRPAEPADIVRLCEENGWRVPVLSVNAAGEWIDVESGEVVLRPEHSRVRPIITSSIRWPEREIEYTATCAGVSGYITVQTCEFPRNLVRAARRAAGLLVGYVSGVTVYLSPPPESGRPAYRVQFDNRGRVRGLWGMYGERKWRVYLRHR